MCFLVGFGGAEGIGISRLYTKPADKMDPTANCHKDKQKNRETLNLTIIPSAVCGEHLFNSSLILVADV